MTAARRLAAILAVDVVGCSHLMGGTARAARRRWRSRSRRAPEPRPAWSRRSAGSTSGPIRPASFPVTSSIRSTSARPDASRAAARLDLETRIAAIAAERGVRAIVAKVHDANAFACDGRIRTGLKNAVEAVGVAPCLLPSGAGHDTMAMGKLCPAGMLFVRCKGGVSHNPLESITVEDCPLGLKALIRFVRDFRAS